MADEENVEEAPIEGAEGETPAGGGRKKLIIIIAGSVVLLLLIVGALLFFMGGDEEPDPEKAKSGETKEEGIEENDGDESPEEKEEAKEEAKAEEKSSEEKTEGDAKAEAPKEGEKPAPPKLDIDFGDTHTFKSLQLNLGNPLENHFVRLEVSVEYRGGELQKLEVEKREPQLRDVIVSIVGKKSREFLLSPDGKDQLRRELLIQMNRYMSKPLESVFITDFLIE